MSLKDKYDRQLLTVFELNAFCEETQQTLIEDRWEEMMPTNVLDLKELIYSAISFGLKES